MTQEPAFHELHAARLEVIASEREQRRLIDEAGERQSWWSSGRVWTKVWGRVSGGAEARRPRLQAMFETADGPQEICVFDYSLDGTEPSDKNCCSLRHPVLGAVTIRRFPEDPKLPMLEAVVRDRPEATVVRYRPGKRCTFRDPVESASPCYLKVFKDGRGERIFAESKVLWNASSAGKLDFLTAKPRSFHPKLNLVVQNEVPGRAIKQRLDSAEGLLLAERLGRSAASIPSLKLGSELVLLVHHAADELERSRRRASELSLLIPESSQPLKELLGALVGVHRRFQARGLFPIHGAPHAGQWLEDHGRLGLVDFDRFSLGDPELDVATFMGEMDFEQTGEVSRRALNHAFIEGYRSRWDRLDPLRLTAYRVHKRLAKAYRTSRSLRPDAPRRTLAHLARAAELVTMEGPEIMDSEMFAKWA